MRVSVIGGGTISETAANRAEAVGRELATRGHTVVCGGRGGTMAAVCRGANDAGGTTIGILPGEHRRVRTSSWISPSRPDLATPETRSFR